MAEYTLTWHDRHAPVWQEVVLPLLPSGRRRWLELGSYEGYSASWTLNNAIRHGDELICVDRWRNAEIERKFDENVGGKVKKVKCDHTLYLLDQIDARQKFSVIYVDGDHDAPKVLSDMVLAWKVLDEDGILIVDDYLWQGNIYSARAVRPCVAIDGFVRSHMTQLQALHWGYQLIARKCCS